MFGNTLDIAAFQLRHATAAGIDNLGFDAVLCHHVQCGLADFRVVVVAEAGGIEHGLATISGSIFIDLRRVRLCPAHKGTACTFRQICVAVDTGDAFHDRTGQAVLAVSRPVGQAGDSATQLTVAVGFLDLLFHERLAALLQLNGTMPEHEMRKVEIEFMRRNVGAFHHEAEIAKRAGIDDGFVIILCDAIDFAG